MAGWSALELAERMGLKAPTITGWLRAGLVTPERPRRGNEPHDIGIIGAMELLTAKVLRDAGFTNAKILKAVRNLRELAEERHPLAKLHVVASGNDIVWQRGDPLSPEQISALQRPGQVLMIFPVGPMYADLLDELEAEFARREEEEKHREEAALKS